jgi:hypothetical protein
MQTFLEWLWLEELRRRGVSLNDYIREGGVVYLYHYTDKLSGVEGTLDPKHFGKNPYTQREKRVLSTPRLFFYIDLRDQEQFFQGHRWLWKASVPAEDIYDLVTDPDGLTKRTTDIGTIVGIVTEQMGKKGLFYNTGSMTVVAWFSPIAVQKYSEEEVLKNDFGTDRKGLADEEAEAQKQREEERKRQEAEAHAQWVKDQEERDKWWAELQAQRARKGA